MEPSIGMRIRILRDMVGLRGRATDELVGVGAGYTRLIETGVRGRRPGGELIGRYALAFGVTRDYLLDGTGAEPTVKAVKAAVERARLRAAARAA